MVRFVGKGHLNDQVQFYCKIDIGPPFVLDIFLKVRFFTNSNKIENARQLNN